MLSFFCPDQVADIGALAGEHFVIEILFPVNIDHAFLQLFYGVFKGLLFPGEHLLSGDDGGLALKAQFKVLFHLLDTHTAFLETGQVFDPSHIFFIENPPVVAVSFDSRNQTFITVEF